MRSVLLPVLLPLMLAAATSATPAAAQTTHACTLAHNTYTCDNVSFQQALLHANSIRFETNRTDRLAQAQLADLAHHLGKTVSTGTPGDLIFVLRPTNNDGINVVNGEVELTTLRIYAPAPSPGGERQLLWAETYRQRPDTPWPIAVHAVISQFEKHFPTH